MELTEEQKQKYNRHIILPEIGIEGQKKLLKAKVLIIGAGGLGSPVALYLAASGIGTIGIADYDVVDLSNLHRQILHTEGDIGILKTQSAEKKMTERNRDISVISHPVAISGENIHDILSDYDFVVDCTDNFESKFLVNDACVAGNKPFSHGGVLAFSGQTMTIIPGQSACYRCVFEHPPDKEDVPGSAITGILGTTPGILGTMQATEAIKYITGAGELLTDRILSFDALTLQFFTHRIKRDNDCPSCGNMRESGKKVW